MCFISLFIYTCSNIFIMVLLDDFKHGYEGLVVLQDAVNDRVAGEQSIMLDRGYSMMEIE